MHFGYRKKVSVSVSAKSGTGKKYRYRYRQNLVPEKSIGIGIEDIWYRKKVSVSVSLKIMGTVTLCLGLGEDVLDMRWEGKGLAILSGGETTVKVRGGGRGGRNQEMVLAFHLAMQGQEEALKGKRVQVQFLNAGMAS